MPRNPKVPRPRAKTEHEITKGGLAEQKENLRRLREERMRAVTERISRLNVNSIVKDNLRQMLSINEGGMRTLVLSESMRGHGETWNGESCTSVNFYYEKETGKILFFENPQYVSDALRKQHSLATFRVAVKSNLIVKMLNLSKSMPEHVRNNLAQSCKCYNEFEGKDSFL